MRIDCDMHALQLSQAVRFDREEGGSPDTGQGRLISRVNVVSCMGAPRKPGWKCLSVEGLV